MPVHRHKKDRVGGLLYFHGSLVSSPWWEKHFHRCYNGRRNRRADIP